MGALGGRPQRVVQIARERPVHHEPHGPLPFRTLQWPPLAIATSIECGPWGK